ncbi:MAG: histidine kinase [Nocardioides sp.]
MQVAPYQPSLRWWGHAWRFAVMAALGLALFAFVSSEHAHVGATSLIVVDVVCGVLAFVVVHLRHRWPFAVALALGVLGTFSSLASGPLLLGAVSLATHRRWRQYVVFGVLLVGGGMFYTRYVDQGPPTAWWAELTVNVTLTGLVLGWGAYIGSRRELVWTLRQRVERAEAEQELRTRQAQSNERTRIAREMHDVLAHRISQISMRSGALAFRDDLSAEELRQGLGDVQEQANSALVDLRGVLGVLRDDSGELVSRPQPTYADIAALIDEAGAAGQRVTLQDELAEELGDRTLPDDLGRTLYRVIQEGLTNARKHAPGTRVYLTLTGGPKQGVTVELTNPTGFRDTAAPGSGLGLVGLAERAALQGGTLTSARSGQSFTLRCWLPWSA